MQKSRSHDDGSESYAPAGTARARIARQGARQTQGRSPSSSPTRTTPGEAIQHLPLDASTTPDISFTNIDKEGNVGAYTEGIGAYTEGTTERDNNLSPDSGNSSRKVKLETKELGQIVSDQAASIETNIETEVELVTTLSNSRLQLLLKDLKDTRV